MHQPLQQAVAGDFARVGVAGHEHDRQTRPHPHGFARQRRSAHGRHGDVGQQHVDLGIGAQLFQRLGAALGDPDAVAEPGEQFGHGAANRRVVVDDQNRRVAFAGLGLERGGKFSGQLRRRGRAGAGQVDAHDRAGVRRAFDPHAAAQLLRGAQDLRQAKAGPGARRLGGEKRLEHLGQHRRGHAVAGVADGDGDVVARAGIACQRFGLGVTLGDGDVGGLDRQRADGRHRVARVDREVEDDQLDLGGIDHRRPEPRDQTPLQADMAAERTAQQAVHAGDNAIEVHRAGQQLLAAGEGEQLAGQRGAAFGRIANGRELRDGAVVARQRALRQVAR